MRVRFSLAEQPADGVLVGQFCDAAAITEIAPVLEVARAAAAVPVDFPEI